MIVDLQELARSVAPSRRGTAFVRPVVPREADVRALEHINITEVIKPWRDTIRQIVSAYTVPTLDAVTDADGTQLVWLVRQQQQAIDRRIIYQTETLGRWVTGTSARHLGATVRNIKSATGVDVEPFMRVATVRPILEAATQENVSLISNLNGDMRRRAEQILLNGFLLRKTRAQVAQELRQALGITLRRAKNIARDQAEKLSATLTKTRNEELGITHFRWLTRLDDRVRKTHEAREGRVYSWATGAPIPEKFPGVAINCRCVAEAVIAYAGSSWRRGGYRRRTRGESGNATDD